MRSKHIATLLAVLLLCSLPVSVHAYDSFDDRTVVAKDKHYIKYSSEVVYDKSIGLEWYAGPDEDFTWDDAKRWISSLNNKGGKWRLPKTDELKALYQKGFGNRNMTSLLETTGWFLWSVDVEGRRFAYPPGASAFCISFEDGSLASCLSNFKKDKRVFAVRSVASERAVASGIDSRKIGLLIASGQTDWIDMLPIDQKLDTGVTAQHMTAICANYALAKNALNLLLARGVSIDCTDKDGRTPLHCLFSISREHLDKELGHLGLTEQYLNIRSEFANLLISHGANVSAVDKKGNAPIHYAAASGYSDGVRLLLKQGVDVNSQNKAGIRAIDFAIYKDRDEVVRLL